MKEQSCACVVERGRTREAPAVTGMGEGCCGLGNMWLLSRGSRWCSVAWSLSRLWPPNMLLSHTITLALSNDRLFKMENGSFSRLGLLKSPPWFMLPLEAMLASVIHAADKDHADVWSVLLQETRWTSVVCTTDGRQADVCGPC